MIHPAWPAGGHWCYQRDKGTAAAHVKSFLYFVFWVGSMHLGCCWNFIEDDEVEEGTCVRALAYIQFMRKRFVLHLHICGVKSWPIPCLRGYAPIVQGAIAARRREQGIHGVLAAMSCLGKVGHCESSDNLLFFEYH